MEMTMMTISKRFLTTKMKKMMEKEKNWI